MKVVFLDIDGVLAGIDWFKKGNKGFIDPSKVAMLNDIGASLVISSSWGFDGGRTEKILRENGLTADIIGYTEHFAIDWLCRGNEIAKWICENVKEYETFEYAIVDDDTDFLLSQQEHFVRVDYIKGLTDENVESIKRILNTQK